MSRQIKLYYLVRFLTSLHFMSAVLIPFFTQWGGINQFQIQLLQSWFAIWVVILEVPTGFVADRYGRKFSMTLGSALFAIGMTIYSLFPNIWLFMLAEFTLALGLALISGADEAWLYEALKAEGHQDQMKQVTGKVQAISMFALSFAAILGGPIASSFGLNAPQLFTASAWFLALLVMVKLPEYKNGQSEIRSAKQTIVESIRLFNSHSKLRRLSLNLVLVAAAAYFVIWLYQPLLSQIGIPIKYFGLFHAGTVAIEMLLSYNFITLEKLVGSASKYLWLTAVLVMLGFVAGGLLPGSIGVVLFLVLAGSFGLTRVYFATSHFHELVPSANRATMRSVLSMYIRLATAIANPIVGFLATKSLNLTLVLIALLPAIVLLVPNLRSPLRDD
ncbi:MFS transporter [Candidatus Beckwithbacteria bacterium]|nr:MFS transporter [Candidatus Beckwithbacteria bacterium]